MGSTHPSQPVKFIELMFWKLEGEVFEEGMGKKLVAAPSFHRVLVQTFLKYELYEVCMAKYFAEL